MSTNFTAWPVQSDVIAPIEAKQHPFVTDPRSPGQRAIEDGKARAPARPIAPDLNAPFSLAAEVIGGLAPEQVELLTEWEKVQANLKSLKAYEMELRKCVVYDGGFFTASKTSGIERVELANGYQLESTKSENYNLKQDKKLLDEVLDKFTDTEAELLVTWKANLSVGNYKKLSEEKKALFNGVLEITDGAPKLEIKPPKTKA